MKFVHGKFLPVLAFCSLLMIIMGCGEKAVTSTSASLTAPATLMRAIVDGSTSETSSLLRRGADPNGSIGSGITQITPLMVASALGKIEVVSLLLQHQADRSPTFMSYNAEDIAFFLNHREILALFSEGNQ